MEKNENLCWTSQYKITNVKDSPDLYHISATNTTAGKTTDICFYLSKNVLGKTMPRKGESIRFLTKGRNSLDDVCGMFLDSFPFVSLDRHTITFVPKSHHVQRNQGQTVLHKSFMREYE